MSCDKQIDDITIHLRSAEEGIKALIGQLDGKARKKMVKANVALLRAHCDLSEARDYCFPDYEPGPEVQSGGT